MPPRFSWSFSSINDFDTCPALYAAKRFYKTIKQTDTVHTVWGKRVHKAAELALTGQQCDDVEALNSILPSVAEQMMKPYTERLVEYKMCVTSAWGGTDWMAKNAWGRGIIDLCVINGDHAHMVDWKTGKVKDGDEQLRIFTVLLAILKPNIQRFTGEYDWVKTGEKTEMRELTRKDLLPVIKEILEKVQRMEEAWRTEVFVARRNGLCRQWCENRECAHCGR